MMERDIIFYTNVAKIADLQAQNASHCELVDRLFLISICIVALWSGVKM